MNKKVAPRVQLNFAPEVDEPEITLSNESLPIEVPQVIERDEIIENDIFDAVDKIKPKVVKEKLKDDSEIIIDEQSEDEIEAPTPAPRARKVKQAKQTQVKEVKQEKKKRQLSEEHKAKLALAREKALATRRAKAEEKKKMKEIETKTKELKKKKAVKDLEELEEEVTKPVKSAPLQPQGQSSMFTKQDLEEAQLQAIMNYEKIRKARKEEKRQQQMIDQQKKDLQKKIQGYGARDANGRLLNKWDRCY
jgi:hypothetical protein